ncbi:MAG: ATP-binding protein [Clostridia bacterium]|nr:ATP-binding protein [Clostridia bacterium]
MDRRIFRRLVAAGFIKSLTLSIAGMIDCAVVGHALGSDRLSAMKLAMPVFSLLSLFSSVLGTGLSVAVSRDLTRGRRDRADAAFGSVYTLSLLIGAACAAVGLARPAPVTALFAGGGLDPGVFAAAAGYVSLMLAFAPAVLLVDILGTVAMLEGADGHMKTASVLLLAVNVAGDVIAVRLKAGMAGIAAATGASYLFACAAVAVFFLGGRSMFRLRPCRPDAEALRRVVTRGLPMAVKGLCGILWPLSVNRLMLRYGTISGLAALSIQDAVHYLPMALCSGIASATLIMSGIYAGEQDGDAMRRLNVTIIRWSLIGGLSIAACLGLAAEPLLRLFSDDPEILALGVSALRLYLVGVPFLALNLAASSYLQGLGLNRVSGLVIFVNHILISISTAFFLARLFGTRGIFASYGLCEVIMAVLLVLNVLLYLYLRGRGAFGPVPEEGPELRMAIGSTAAAAEASRQAGLFCAAHGIGPRDAYHIALCTEELAVNSIEHGFTDGKEHHLELRAVIADGRLILRLRDDGRRFDLVERYRIVNPEDPTRNIGLRIVFANAEDVSYSSAFSMNNVCVRYLIRTPEAPAA